MNFFVTYYLSETCFLSYLTAWDGVPCSFVGGCAVLKDVPGLATEAILLSSIRTSAKPSSSFSVSSTHTCSVSALVFRLHAAYLEILFNELWYYY